MQIKGSQRRCGEQGKDKEGKQYIAGIIRLIQANLTNQCKQQGGNTNHHQQMGKWQHLYKIQDACLIKNTLDNGISQQ